MILAQAIEHAAQSSQAGATGDMLWVCGGLILTAILSAALAYWSMSEWRDLAAKTATERAAAVASAATQTPPIDGHFDAAGAAQRNLDIGEQK